MRISDWSSDVCSSDLRSDQPAPNSLYVVAQGSSAVPSARATALDSQFRRSYPDPSERDSFHTTASASPCGFVANAGICVAEPRLTSYSSLTHRPPNRRSEQRRVGKESVSTGRSRWWTEH